MTRDGLLSHQPAPLGQRDTDGLRWVVDAGPQLRRQAVIIKDGGQAEYEVGPHCRDTEQVVLAQPAYGARFRLESKRRSQPALGTIHGNAKVYPCPTASEFT